MNIMLLTNCYPPEIGAAANQLYELAQELRNRGNYVSVVTRYPRHVPKSLLPKDERRFILRENDSGIRILRVRIPQFSRRIPLLREIEHILNIVFLLIAAMLSEQTQVTLVYSPPIVVGFAAVLLRMFRGSKVVFNVQDIFPQSMIDLGLLKNRFLIVLSRFFEKLIYKLVDVITVHSDGNKKIVDLTSSAPKKVIVVPNWVDTNYIIPGDRNDDFRREYDLRDRFVVSFAGCMSDAQDMEIILDSAKKLININNIIFLLAGNGPNYENIRQKAGKISNVMVIPIQPRSKYVHLLAASDIALVTLNRNVATPVVPSKILSIMSAGRAFIAAFPPNGDAPKIVKESGGGIFVNSGDLDSFVDAIEKLYNNAVLRKQCGENGRKYVVKNFSLQSCSQMYENIFKKLVVNE